MKKYLIIIAALSVLGFISSCHRRGETGGEVQVQKDTVLPLGFLTDDYAVDSTKVREGETFTSLMNRLGLGASAAYALAENADSVFDVRRMRAGNAVEAYHNRDSARALQYVVYHNDRVNECRSGCTIAGLKTYL